MTMLLNTIKGASAFVTGGGSGLGLAVCRHLARLGARVVTIDLKPSEEKIDNVQGIKGDIRKEADIMEALKLCQDSNDGQQRLNILVNCAGVANAFKLYNFNSQKPQRLQDFLDLVEINIYGTFNVIRLSIPLLANNPLNANGTKSVIINTSSILAWEGHEGQTGYSATQGALNSMTLPLSRDLAKEGIRVNTIAAGFFETPLVMRSNAPELFEFIQCSTPCPSRLGKPEEFSKLVETIIENPMLNGEIIRLDGACRWPERG
ncbi:3-hydroxyacyl-CoA dehydrogenase-like protein [Euroglyphus maynei]|uniref:3-hydroxyacyl-CoA dehydrogenase-like protein n=1 Tax=Euroglyphus maynei TaxID=6958 RepID=A0A1Y3BPA4_EURMA|nr:3-hydroxyacyl-CoA dehydrogenase-like protein [Euroglyphus maynei]